MIGLETGLEIRHGGVMRLRAAEDKTAVLASYRSVSRNPVCLRLNLKLAEGQYQFSTQFCQVNKYQNKHYCSH